MKFTRKEFLKTGALITGGVLVQGHKFLYRAQEKVSGFKTIRDNVGIYTERGGTIGWYAAKDAVVVIDSQFPDSVKNFMTELHKKTGQRISRFFNTHHHGDHTSGNVYIKDFTDKMIAHERCVELQKKSYGNDPNKPQAYADTTFEKEWREELGSETVSAKYFGPAHTGGDAVIHFEKANVAHVGDLVFNKTFPFIDSNGGGSVANWPKVVDAVARYYSNDTLFICGHAASDDIIIATKGDLISMRDYLSALVDFVSKGIKDGKTKEEMASASAIPGFENMKERRDGARKMNLEKTYDELNKK